MNLASFPLTTSPWIPVLDLARAGTGDEFREVGLSEALTRAHQLRLAPGGAQEEAVLLRLLLALYDAAAGPSDTAEWDAAWQEETLDPQGRVAAYLQRWSTRFDLFDPERPFAQCGHLHTYRRGPDVLDPAYLGGAGGALFNPALRTPRAYPPHPPAQAARYLLILLGYDVAGIKGAAPAADSGEGGSLGRTYGAHLGPVGQTTQLSVRGRTLKDTLLLNLPPRPRADGDTPVWERECPEPGVHTRRPAGRLDYLTWPARRLRLRPDEHGRVDALAWHDGDRVEGESLTAAALDHTAVWRRTTRGGQARGVLFDKHFAEVVPWDVAQVLHPHPAHPAPARSATVDHVLAAARRGTVDPDYPLRLGLSAATYNAYLATITDVCSGEADLGPVRLHTGTDALTRRLAYVAHRVQFAVAAIRKDASESLPVMQDVDKRIPLDPASTTRAWHDMIGRFAALPADADDQRIVDCVLPFHQTLREQLRAAVARLPLRSPADGQPARFHLEHSVDRLCRDLLLPLPASAEPSGQPDTGDAERAAESATRRRRGGGRPSPLITIFGESKTRAQWAADPRCQVTPLAFRNRLANGWPPEHALTAPPRAPRPDSPPSSEE
ncbi:type I-E CRISPR-associated protein Cse1/CasA [Amycolatopsis magusensis]|uniref:type I-E CRISPR-associated protein Cse1/CasA n=1 Tax=Amycolatopsis magusensis TaxID=882444 RepID=UPI003795551C